MAHRLRPASRRIRLRPAVVLRTLATALLVALATLLALAPAASAHVTVSTPDAAPGGYGKLVFRVPTESESASTVKLTVTLPAATPFAAVSAKTMPGWSVATTEKKLAKPITDDDGFTLTKAVSTVTWTASAGQGVAPGEFNEFELSVGPFPEGTSPIDPAGRADLQRRDGREVGPADAGEREGAGAPGADARAGRGNGPAAPSARTRRPRPRSRQPRRAAMRPTAWHACWAGLASHSESWRW